MIEQWLIFFVIGKEKIFTAKKINYQNFVRAVAPLSSVYLQSGKIHSARSATTSTAMINN